MEYCGEEATLKSQEIFAVGGMDLPVEVMLFTKKDCPNCPQAKRTVGDVASELGDRVQVREYDLDDEDDLLTALQNQIMSTPSVVIDERLVSVGRAPTREELMEAIELAEGK